MAGWSVGAALHQSEGLSMISQERIDAVNAANASAVVLQDNLREILTPYLGRKAWKISGYGGPVAALERELTELQSQEAAEGSYFVVCKSVSWLYCTLRLDRERMEISLGKVSEDGTLLELFETQERRTNFTVAEVAGALEKARELEQQAREIRGSVREFTR